MAGICSVKYGLNMQVLKSQVDSPCGRGEPSRFRIGLAVGLWAITLTLCLVHFQVFGYMLGEQNVTGITAIHHALRDVDSGAGDISLLVQVTDLIDRAAVNTHPHP